jgi:hypothetical protein
MGALQIQMHDCTRIQNSPINDPISASQGDLNAISQASLAFDGPSLN